MSGSDPVPATPAGPAGGTVPADATVGRDAGLLYHCATQAQWEELQRDGESRVSTRGRTLEQEGFIHCSYADQVAGVLERYYADVDEQMLLLRVDPALSAARVVVENGFPHIYGPLPLPAVLDAVPLTRGEHGWELPLAPE